MASLVRLVLNWFASIFLVKSHPLKRYRDRVVGQQGILDLDRFLIPTKSNHRRLLIIGDVHGCLEELRHLLKKCAFDASHDHILLVGDLVAKGPFSLDTISFVRSLGKSVSAVRGNHDDKLMQWHTYLTEKYKDGRVPDDLSHVKLPDELSRRDEHRFLAKNLDTDQVNFLESLPYIIRFTLGSQAYVVVHAGIVPRKSLTKQKCWDVTNMRNIHHKQAVDHREAGEGWYKAWEKLQHASAKHERQIVIYGHDAGRDLNLRQYTKGLDSRCVRGGTLTAMILSATGEQFVHVQAKRRYD